MNKIINKFPLIIFAAFLLLEISNVWLKGLIPEILASIMFILSAIVVGFSALFFMTMAVGIALGFIFIAMKSIIQQH